MFKRTISVAFVTVLLAVLAAPAALSAHERREIGDLTVVVGFLNEPAFEGQVNGASIRISQADTDSAGGPSTVPVTGLASSLQVEMTHIPSDTSRTVPVRSVFGQDGLYVADFVPTSPGGYTFRFFGEIEGEAFDEMFSSGPETFDEVQSAREVQFPLELRETRELQGAIEGLQGELVEANDAASDAESTASTALAIGIVGVVVGVIGVGAGGYSLMSARRKS